VSAGRRCARLVRFHLYFPYSSKANLEPVRLLHFMTVVYVATAVTSGGAGFWRHTIVWPVVVTGQQSLLVFGFGSCSHSPGAW
jgi:OpgC protein